MIIHPQFDPIAFSAGPLSVRWYGLMYLLAFAFVMLLGRLRINSGRLPGWDHRDLDDILFYGVLGVVLGGRIGYVLFYKPAWYLANPAEILAVWQGGMAFHGGFIGVLVAMWLFARKSGKSWLSITDFIAPLVPLGLGAGRIGNFINGELWGRESDLPWAMAFPQRDMVPRHPSQLYEFALEGLVLFAVLWLFSRRDRPLGAVSAVFLMGYGGLRFAAEFTREPDDFLGLLSFGLSMGQWLSMPMVLAGVLMFIWAYRRPVAGAQ